MTTVLLETTLPESAVPSCLEHCSSVTDCCFNDACDVALGQIGAGLVQLDACALENVQGTADAEKPLNLQCALDGDTVRCDFRQISSDDRTPFSGFFNCQSVCFSGFGDDANARYVLNPREPQSDCDKNTCERNRYTIGSADPRVPSLHVHRLEGFMK